MYFVLYNRIRVLVSCFTRNEVKILISLIVHFQRQFSINVWAGIVSDRIIGPFVLRHRVNGPGYLNFLCDSLPELSEDVPLAIRREM